MFRSKRGAHSRTSSTGQNRRSSNGGGNPFLRPPRGQPFVVMRQPEELTGRERRATRARPAPRHGNTTCQSKTTTGGSNSMYKQLKKMRQEDGFTLIERSEERRVGKE